MYKAVIFDRDATLNRTTQILRRGQSEGDPTDGYVLSTGELELFPAVKPALALLRKQGVLPFVFTQQNCIGKGLVSEEDVAGIHAHMNKILGEDARIEAFKVAWAPSHRAKPAPDMINEILAEYGLHASEVLVAGDSMRDYQSAIAAGTDYAWVRDDLLRVTEEDMKKTGCPVFDDVLALVKECVPPVSSPQTPRPKM